MIYISTYLIYGRQRFSTPHASHQINDSNVMWTNFRGKCKSAKKQQQNSNGCETKRQIYRWAIVQGVSDDKRRRQIFRKMFQISDLLYFERTSMQNCFEITDSVMK